MPYLIGEQMREVDRTMIEDYHIELIQMMENTGRGLARLGRERFRGGRRLRRRVAVLADSYGNDGGALVAARHLLNHGAEVSVVISKSGVDFTGIPAYQVGIIQRMGASP